MDWTDDQSKAFADILVRAREALGLKQYQVAEKGGVSAGTISSLERGPYPGMRAIDIWRLEAFYGIPLTQLPQSLGLYIADEPALEGSPFAPYVNRIAHLGPRDQKIVLEVLDVLLDGFFSR
jgi:transcriptional regulator with XRE-family HTH domain